MAFPLLNLDCKRERCVEERLCLQLRNGDGDAEAGLQGGVEDGLSGSSKGSLPAGPPFHSDAGPATDALWSPLPSRHEAFCGKGKFGREEKEEDGGEGGDHSVQGVGVQ